MKQLSCGRLHTCWQVSHARLLTACVVGEAQGAQGAGAWLGWPRRDVFKSQGRQSQLILQNCLCFFPSLQGQVFKLSTLPSPANYTPVRHVVNWTLNYENFEDMSVSER